MKRAALLPLSTLLLIGTPVVAGEWAVTTDTGVIWVEDDSARFGDFTGLNEDGFELLLSGDGYWTGEDGYRWDFYADQLALDSREFFVTGGKQGFFDLYLGYDEIPRYFYDDTESPFLGFGSANLTLPDTWVRSGSTGGFTDLDNSLRGVSVDYSRNTLELGGSFIPAELRRWELAFDAKRTERDGNRLFSGNLGSISQFAQPLDDTTDDLHAGVSYVADTWQAAFDYNGSFYDNDNSRQTWENPFSGPPGREFGQQSLTPDNDFHQLSLSGSGFFRWRTTLTGLVSVGQMSQDDDFLPYTINPTLVTDPLPRTNLDGEVDTLDVSLRATSSPWQDWTFTGEYRKNERENDSPQDIYNYIITDQGPAGSSPVNLPYGHDKQLYRLKADYRLFRRTKILGGVEREEIDRDFQERSTTETDSYWLRFNAALPRLIDFAIETRYEDRDGSRYEPFTPVTGAQNPLMRKYNLADRERLAAKFDTYIRPSQDLTLSFNAEWTDDDYDDSEIGLTEAERLALTANLNLSLASGAYLYGMYSWEDVESEQAGSQSFSEPDWLGFNDDNFQTAVIGLMFDEIAQNLDFRVDYTWAKSKGEVRLTTLGTNSPYPDLRTRLGSLKFYFDYHWDSVTTIKAGVWHEHYSSDDWSLDGVEPDTVNNLLSLGAQSQGYSQNVLWTSVSYRFGGGPAARP